MGRPHIEFVRAADIEPQSAAVPGPFAGCMERVLSRDDETSASTALVGMPPAWSGDLAAAGSPLELFVLEGRLELAGEQLGPGFYAYVPQTSGSSSPLSTSTAAHVLAMVEAPGSSSGGGELLVKDTTAMRWAASAFAEVPAGLVNKRLRDDPATGERTWVAACPPGWMETRAEVHPTVEESLTLRGDILLGRRGGMTPGCYFWRPPMVPHGPMYSRGGAEFFFRTKGGTLDVDYETVADWDALVEEYQAQEPLYGSWPVGDGRSAPT
jgi:hypothetical protein